MVKGLAMPSEGRKDSRWERAVALDGVVVPDWGEPVAAWV
jgi:hypothetical protein